MTRRALFAMAFLFPLASAGFPAGLPEADTRALRDVTKRYVETVLAGDWDAWATLLAADAVFLPPNATPVEGRAAIRTFMTGYGGVASFVALPQEIFGSDSIAYARGTYELTMGPRARMQGSDSGKWITTYEKQHDGSWLIKRNIWSSSLALASAPVPPNPAHSSPADERAIREVVQTLTAALNARDYAAAAAPFVEDGDLILPGGPRVSGRAAIRAAWERAWSPVPGRRIAVAIRGIRFLCPDAAIVDLTAEFSAGEPARDRATYVMVRRGVRWEAAALRVYPSENP